MSYLNISTPYPLTGNTWTLYTGDTPTGIYSGGTTEVTLVDNFAYGETYWVKIEEVDNPKQFLIKNITIHDAIAFNPPEPTPSVTPTVTPSISISVTPSAAISPTPTATPTGTPAVTPSVTPSITVSPGPVTGNFSISSAYGWTISNVSGTGLPALTYPSCVVSYTGTISAQTLSITLTGSGIGGTCVDIIVNGSLYETHTPAAAGTFTMNMPSITAPDDIFIGVDSGC